jgi:hypothetical protein
MRLRASWHGIDRNTFREITMKSATVMCVAFAAWALTAGATFAVPTYSDEELACRRVGGTWHYVIPLKYTCSLHYNGVWKANQRCGTCSNRASDASAARSGPAGRPSASATADSPAGKAGPPPNQLTWSLTYPTGMSAPCVVTLRLWRTGGWAGTYPGAPVTFQLVLGAGPVAGPATTDANGRVTVKISRGTGVKATAVWASSWTVTSSVYNCPSQVSPN